jgi:hypothetical protein
MNAHTIISPAVDALDRAQQERAAALASITGWYVLKYVGKALMTFGGPYSDLADAKMMTPEVGRWIEQSPTEHRSEDGRTLLRA